MAKAAAMAVINEKYHNKRSENRKSACHGSVKLSEKEKRIEKKKIAASGIISKRNHQRQHML